MTYSSSSTSSSSDTSRFDVDNEKLNTPFEIPYVTNEENYVHLHPITGRKFQLSVKTVTNRDSAGVETKSQVNVWSAVSDVTNRIWVGSEDPKPDTGSTAGAPRKGDLWWDDHQLELRVLHQPVLGVKAEGGDKKDILGRADWISSTHPMGNSIDLDGSDKNHMFGDIVITGKNEGFLLSGESATFEVEMPFYTGDDGPHTQNMGPDLVPDSDKRYTYEWSVTPSYNLIEANMDGMTEEEKLTYKNVIEFSGDFQNRIEVTAGSIASGASSQLITVSCIVQARPGANDKFIVQGVDAEGVPTLHYSRGSSRPQTIISRGSAAVIVPTVPVTTTYAYFKDMNNITDLYGGDDETPITMMMFPTLVNKGYQYEGDTPSWDDETELDFLLKRDDVGIESLLLDQESGRAQVPHSILTYDKFEYENVVFYFDYGVAGAAFNADVFPDSGYITSNFNPPDGITAGMTSEDLAENYKIVFYKEGYEQNGNGPPTQDELDNLYGDEDKYTYNTNEEVTSLPFNDGLLHIVRKVTISYTTSNTPASIYYAVKDKDDNIIPELHGMLTIETPNRSATNE